MMMMTQNKMVSSVTDHHEMAPNARLTHTVNAEAQLRTSGAAYVGGEELKLV